MCSIFGFFASNFNPVCCFSKFHFFDNKYLLTITKYSVSSRISVTIYVHEEKDTIWGKIHQLNLV